MDRIDTTQADLLASLRDHLRNELGLPPNRCYCTDAPDHLPAAPRGGEYTVTLAAGDSQFFPGEQSAVQCTEDQSILVTAFARNAADRVDELDRMLLDTSRGLATIKRELLRAVVGRDLPIHGAPFLRQLLFVRRSTRPRLVEHATPGAVLGTFALEIVARFDWDLQ